MEKLGPGVPTLFYFQAAGPNGGCSWPLKRLEEVLGDYALSFTTEFNYSHPGCSVRIVWREAVAAFRKEGYMLCCREGSISKSESVGYEGFNGNEVRVGRLLLSRWSESFPSRLRYLLSTRRSHEEHTGTAFHAVSMGTLPFVPSCGAGGMGLAESVLRKGSLGASGQDRRDKSPSLDLNALDDFDRYVSTGMYDQPGSGSYGGGGGYSFSGDSGGGNLHRSRSASARSTSPLVRCEANPSIRAGSSAGGGADVDAVLAAMRDLSKEVADLKLSSAREIAGLKLSSAREIAGLKLSNARLVQEVKELRLVGGATLAMVRKVLSKLVLAIREGIDTLLTRLCFVPYEHTSSREVDIFVPRDGFSMSLLLQGQVNSLVERLLSGELLSGGEGKPSILVCETEDEAAHVLSRLSDDFLEILYELQDFGVSKDVLSQFVRKDVNEAIVRLSAGRGW